jgi:hypothetical protein
VIETKKGVVRLLPVAERAKQLFGEDGASAVAARLEQTATLGTNPLQGMLFPEMEAAPRVRSARERSRRGAVDISDESLAAAREATTLGPRSRLPAPRQRALRALPEGLRGEAALSLARLYRAHQREREARDVLSPIYAWFTEGFTTRDLVEAKDLLDQLHYKNCTTHSESKLRQKLADRMRGVQSERSIAPRYTAADDRKAETRQRESRKRGHRA